MVLIECMVRMQQLHYLLSKSFMHGTACNFNSVVAVYA